MFHYKKSEDMEIYETDFVNNQKIQEVSDLKQPFLFELKPIIPDFFENTKINGGSHQVCVKDTKDMDSGNYFVLPFSSSRALIDTDDKGRYFSEKNYEMTEDIFTKENSTLDELLKPSFTIVTKHDIMFGSKGAYTPMRYITDYRQYLCVLKGKIHVKMTPWKSRKYLYPKNDYNHYEFRSPIDVWNPQPQYSNETDKIQYLEFDVYSGNVLYIPPFWFYSIKYLEDDTYIHSVIYDSIMNVVANSPKWTMFFLTRNNKPELDVPVIPNKKVVENFTEDKTIVDESGEPENNPV